MEMTTNPRRLPPPEYAEESRYVQIPGAPEGQDVPLTHYLWVLRRNRWRIIGFVFAVVTAALLYALQLTPQYDSVALLEIENQVPMFEVGNASVASWDYRNYETQMNTQLELMQSPVIAQQLIQELRLDRNPDFNPAMRKKPQSPMEVVGSASPTSVASALPGLDVRRRADTYLLEVRYRSHNPELATAIANAAAQKFVQQGFLTRYETAAELSKWLNKQLEELKARLERAQQAMRAYEKEHHVVNPEDRTNLMNLQLQQLQDELTKTQAERLRKESAYRSVESGNPESLAVSTQGEALNKITERLETLETQLAEASAQYGPNHPNYKKLEVQIVQVRELLERNKQSVLKRLAADYQQALNREKALGEAVAEQKAEVDRLSARAVEYGILKREVESLTKLHDELLKKINEASINASVRATNLRLAALASTPRKPVSPRIELYVLLAFLLSTTAAVGAALAADYLDRTLHSSEQVEQWLSLPVLASVPRVATKRAPALLLAASSDQVETAALAKSRAPFAESLSILRTTMLLSSAGNEIRTVLIASAAPAEGKTTVATGLAFSLAQQLHNGDRVLLLDSDLRRPTIHNIFGLPNRLGLSTVLEGQSTLAESILASGAAPNLMVLPAGPSPRYATELLMAHMAKLLENLRQEFRYVVVDSAPVLVCADTTVLSTMTDGVVMVARAGDTPREAVAAALRQLRRARANLIGVVLNQISLPETPGYRGYYSGYYYNKPDNVQEDT